MGRLAVWNRCSRGRGRLAGLRPLFPQETETHQLPMMPDHACGGAVGRVVALAVTALGLSPTSALACAACFGKSDSAMAQGMNMGVFTLLLVVLAVLMGIASFFFYLIRRARQFEAAAAQDRKS